MSRWIGPASRSELERRWSLVRDRLKDQDIDALVVLGQSNDLDGAVRWLTDAPIVYRRVVVFDPNELMTVYEHGAAGRSRETDGAEEGYPGVGRIVGTATFQSIDYTSVYEAHEVIDLVKTRGYRRIALYHPLALPFGFIATLRDVLGNIAFIDETEFLDHAKAVKSPEEIAVIERAAAIQDTVIERTLPYIEPGRRDADVAAYAFYQAKLLGGDFGLTLVGSAPHGELAHYRQHDQQGRVIQAGDALGLLVENGSPGGYFLEVGRMISLGPPSQELVDIVGQAQEAQTFTLSLMKPGVKASDVYAAYTDYLRERGHPPDLRLYAHGQGYDLIERPLIRGDETMTLEVGMCLAVHPGLSAKGAFGTICDNVVIEPDGPRILHKTPRPLLQI